MLAIRKASYLFACNPSPYPSPSARFRGVCVCFSDSLTAFHVTHYVHSSLSHCIRDTKVRQRTTFRAIRVGLLFCPFCFCCGWLACWAVLAFFPSVFGLSGERSHARPQPQNAAIYGVLLRLRFRAFLAALSGASGARARPHVSLLGWGPAGAQKAGIPGIIGGWGGQHASHIIAQDTFLTQNMT